MQRKRNRLEKFQGSKFRWLNQTLYTTSSESAKELFQDDTALFDTYHEGYRQQIHDWPEKPIDRIEADIKTFFRKKRIVVADLGCGEGCLAERLRDMKKATVRSFDLVSIKPHIEVADIANLPLDTETVDIAVFSLSLMGVNHVQFIQEAHRCLKKFGTLIIAEVASRIPSVSEFLKSMKSLGFKLKHKDTENPFFTYFRFIRASPISTVPDKLLEPGKYKKR
jgi:SAM-dependent methyltransferase